MRIAIVEDEVIWQAKLESTLKTYPWKEHIQIDKFSCGEAFYDKKGYDIVFMDIEMDKMDGFKTAHLYKENNEDSILIFLTTHTEMSRQGYLVNAFRFVDKAHMAEELDEALKAIDDLQSRNHIVTFHVVNMGQMHVKAKDILYIETEKRNVIIHTKEQDFVSNRKMDELEEELREWGFFRCHKSYLVNLENIYTFDKLHIHFQNGSKALVSTRKYVELKDRYIEQKFKTANA